jgi:hypothetical protein
MMLRLLFGVKQWNIQQEHLKSSKSICFSIISIPYRKQYGCSYAGWWQDKLLFCHVRKFLCAIVFQVKHTLWNFYQHSINGGKLHIGATNIESESRLLSREECTKPSVRECITSISIYSKSDCIKSGKFRYYSRL